MTGKTYWLTDTEGTFALVESAEDRDRFVRVHGWTEAGEPSPSDFVWVRNEDSTLGAARLTWEAAQLDAWAGRGWAAGAPPEPVNAATAHWEAAQVHYEAPAKSSPAKPSASSGEKPASSGEKKE